MSDLAVWQQPSTTMASAGLPTSSQQCCRAGRSGCCGQQARENDQALYHPQSCADPKRFLLCLLLLVLNGQNWFLLRQPVNEQHQCSADRLRCCFDLEREQFDIALSSPVLGHGGIGLIVPTRLSQPSQYKPRLTARKSFPYYAPPEIVSICSVAGLGPSPKTGAAAVRSATFQEA